LVLKTNQAYRLRSLGDYWVPPVPALLSSRSGFGNLCSGKNRSILS